MLFYKTTNKNVSRNKKQNYSLVDLLVLAWVTVQSIPLSKVVSNQTNLNTYTDYG